MQGNFFIIAEQNNYSPFFSHFDVIFNLCRVLWIIIDLCRLLFFFLGSRHFDLWLIRPCSILLDTVKERFAKGNIVKSTWMFYIPNNWFVTDVWVVPDWAPLRRQQLRRNPDCLPEPVARVGRDRSPCRPRPWWCRWCAASTRRRSSTCCCRRTGIPTATSASSALSCSTLCNPENDSKIRLSKWVMLFFSFTNALAYKWNIRIWYDWCGDIIVQSIHYFTYVGFPSIYQSLI